MTFVDEEENEVAEILRQYTAKTQKFVEANPLKKDDLNRIVMSRLAEVIIIKSSPFQQVHLSSRPRPLPANSYSASAASVRFRSYQVESQESNRKAFLNRDK